MLLVVVLLPLVALAEGTHRVSKGQTLWSIARAHGCTVDEVFAANRDRLASPRAIRPGQTLVIPDCVGPSTPASGCRKRCCGWGPRDADDVRLPALLKKAGVKLPAHFRAVVVRTTLSRDGRGIDRHEVFTSGADAFDHEHWNPASTVKLFSAIGALERVSDLGFGPKTRVTFHYERGDRAFALADLLEDALHASDNLPHNRLVQLAGFDALNGRVLKRVGIGDSYVMRAYQLSDWQAEGHASSLRAAPRITLRENKRTKTLPASTGTGTYPCEGAACTSVSDLAKTMCVMMLHEQLPPERRLRLGKGPGQGPLLKALRRAMDRKRKGKADPVWDAFSKAFPEPRYRLFRKAGFSQEWLSENVYVYAPGTRTRWIVSMAARGGRGVLTGAAGALAGVLKEGAL